MKNFKLYEITQVAIFSSLSAIAAYIFIPLPFSSVPITAQTLVLMLCGNVLTPIQAFWSLTIVLLLGSIGLPVFSGGGAGLGKLFGPTGGYLLAMPIAAYIISALSAKSKDSLAGTILINVLGGIVAIYALGVPYLAWLNGIGMSKAFIVGALPFIPGDLFKAVAAAIAARSLNKASLMTRRDP